METGTAKTRPSVLSAVQFSAHEQASHKMPRLINGLFVVLIFPN